MTLRDRLVARIRADGPMRLSAYMAACLLDPEDGYYTTSTPFGVDGDFTTAPEMSQMFGECLALCLAQAWLDQGKPRPVTLAELGPGRGTLMADMLRTLRSVPDLADALQVVLVEASPRLRAVQRDRVGPTPVTWVDHVAELPDTALLLVANEFFDALPIRQFVRDRAGWRERQIGLDGDALAFGLGPVGPQPDLGFRLADTTDGDVVEICPSAGPIVAEIGQRIASKGGAALILDYGNWRSLGDTFQALRNHAPEDPLSAPGDADLTAHVDFEALAAAATTTVTRMTPQGVMLERLGITARAQRLAQSLSGDALDAHVAAHRRLTHPDEMGNLFKVLGFYPRTAPPPAGLDT